MPHSFPFLSCCFLLFTKHTSRTHPPSVLARTSPSLPAKTCPITLPTLRHPQNCALVAALTWGWVTWNIGWYGAHWGQLGGNGTGSAALLSGGGMSWCLCACVCVWRGGGLQVVC